MSTDETLTKEQKYQRDYYQDHAEERRQYAKDRWENDREYREREIQRSSDRRALERAEKGRKRFKAMVEKRKAEDPDTRCPLKTEIDGEPVWVYTTGELAREVGRSPRAIRAWLREGALPGATIWIKGRAYFSERFCKAVYAACEELFLLDGRGDKKVLKVLIIKALRKEGITYVTYEHRGDNSVRVRADDASKED